MRRGGGSRGGGFRGGSRSSGFRGHRTSRRHHHRHGGFYGRRRYGYGYYGYGGGGIGIIIFGIILLIIIIGLIIGVSAYFGASNNVNVNLDPNNTRLFHPDTNRKDNIEVIDSSGVIQTHFFSSRPPLQSGTVNRTEIENSLLIRANDYESFGFYLIKESQVDVTWLAGQEVIFHIVEGKGNFDKWVDGDDTQIFEEAGPSSTETFTVNKDNEYYFIFWNSNSATSLTADITFNIRAKAYDVSNSASMETGSFSKSIGSKNYIVVLNPTANDITFEYIENSKYSTGTVFIVIAGSVAIIAWLIIRKRRSNKKAKQNYVGGAVVGSQVNVHDTGKAPLNQQYYQRPQAKLCNACGSGILQNSSFCTECGTKV